MFTNNDLISQIIRENNIKRIVVTRKQFEEGTKPIVVRQTIDYKNNSVIFEFSELESEGK